jgi:hypothetical protein
MDAPVRAKVDVSGFALAVICFPIFNAYPVYLTKKDQTEVCSLSRPSNLHSRYPPHYSMALAFSVLLYPQNPQRFLHHTCHWGDFTGLPCFAYDSEWVGLFLCTGDRSVHDRAQLYPYPDRIPFGPSLSAS